jgi:mandelamide amidase
MIELSACDAVAAMVAGDISAEVYADALLAACAAGRDLNAFITLEPDRVREAARAADRLRAAGGPVGPLHGLPVPVKDSVNTRDLRTTAGTRSLSNFHPQSDAVAVARLRAAGASVLGKTNLHELSFGWTSNNLAFGPVRNPYDLRRIPGGSSGGTAAAVAARMAPLGVAEDTQGSIRVPAALCGICGFRPTTGRYPTEGTAPITPLFDQIGPHARWVEDLALFDAVMTNDRRPIAPAPLRGLRIGLVRSYYFAGLDAEVERQMDHVLARLREAGVVFVEADLPELPALIAQITGPVQIHDAAAALTAYLQTSGAPVTFDQMVAAVSPDVRVIFERFVVPGAPFAVSPSAYAAARDVHRPALQRLFADYFARRGITAILFPATMTPAPLIGEDQTVAINGVAVPFATAMARNISPGSTAGLPGVVLPVGLSNDTRLPVALELDGPAGSDRTLLSVALAIKALTPPMPAPDIARLKA